VDTDEYVAEAGTGLQAERTYNGRQAANRRLMRLVRMTTGRVTIAGVAVLD
jgi:hypothetical protein